VLRPSCRLWESPIAKLNLRIDAVVAKSTAKRGPAAPHLQPQRRRSHRVLPWFGDEDPIGIKPLGTGSIPVLAEREDRRPWLQETYALVSSLPSGSVPLFRARRWRAYVSRSAD